MKSLFNSYSLKTGLVSFACLVFTTGLFAQFPPGLLVNDPPGIAGFYQTGLGDVDWGQPITGSGMSWTGDLQIVNDTAAAAVTPTQGCIGPLENDLTGFIAFVDRGGCEFGTKVLNAENAGAIAVIIANNNPGEGIPFNPSGGVDGPSTTIPAVLISFEDGQGIRAVLEGGGTVNATIGEPVPIEFDMAISAATHAPNTQTPVAHVQDVNFQADISNNGTSSQSSATLAVEVEDGDGTSVYSESITLDMGLEAGFQDSTLIGTGAYTPPGCLGDYDMTWTLTSSDGEEFNGDNVVTNPFSTSASTFAKDNMPGGGIAPALGGTYEFGNIYELMVPDSAVSITFALAKNDADGPLDNENLTLYLLKVDCDLGDPGCTGNFNDSQITPVGVAFFTVPPGTADYDLLTADLIDYNFFTPGPLPLDAGVYMALVSITGNGVDNTIFTSTGSNRYYPGQLVSVVREGGALDVGGGGGTWFLAGFGEDTPAVVRLNVTSGGDATPCLVTGIAPVERLEAEINLFPNPASRAISLDLELPSGINEAEIKISDIMGRVIHLQRVEQQNSTLVFDVNNLAGGTYFLTVTADDGKLVTKRFAVAR